MFLSPDNWKYRSQNDPGFHRVVSPETTDCQITSVFRLNLLKKKRFELANDELELNAVLISGRAKITFGRVGYDMERLDSFYLPGTKKVTIEAVEDCFFYVGGGPYEVTGEFYFRKFDLSLPLGDIHQIHGKPPYKREVFMTVNQEVPASRIICGLTFGDEGGWTSWPQHQHTKDLEEVYCYFDIPPPKFALHLSSTKPGEVETVHKVSTGDCIIIPAGYHPTVAIPGVKSSYFWVMVAHSKTSRRYDLAVSDPNFG